MPGGVQTQSSALRAFLMSMRGGQPGQPAGMGAMPQQGPAAVQPQTPQTPQPTQPALGQTERAQVLEQSQPTPQPQPDQTDDALRPNPARVRDADNPEALAYAKQRLALLAQAGYTPDLFGLHDMDPTALWRALSPIAGVLAAIRGGHAGDYHPGAGINPQVLAMIQKLLEAATHADSGPAQPARPAAGAAVAA